MNFVNCVVIRVKSGSEANFEAAIRENMTESRKEPGCITYQLHRSKQDPLQYFIYERYADEAAFRFHQSTDHFTRIVRGVVPGLVEGRDISQYVPVE